jgi:hypothetical protein
MVRNVVFVEDAAGWVGVYIDGLIENVALEGDPQGIADLLNGETCTISFTQDDSEYGSLLSGWPSHHAWPVTVRTFFERHAGLGVVYRWAEENCTEMQDAWDKLKPSWLIWVALQPGVLSDKELRLFAVHCARSIEHLFKDERTTKAIDVAELFANDSATENELTAAREGAWLVHYETRRPALFDAAFASCAKVARTAAKFASDSAINAFEDSSSNLESQAKWLRENTKPNFERTNTYE